MVDLPTDDQVRADARDDLLFMTQFCDARYQVGRFHSFLASALHDCAAGRKRRIILNTPPQHGKSRLCSIELGAWLLGRDPTLNIATGSYSQHLATRNSRACRARVMGEEYRYLFPGTRLDAGRQSVNDWGVVGGGGYKAVGRGGSLTGHPADWLIIDDIIKDHAEATSPAIRNLAWEWFLSVAYTRLSERGVILFVMTRWHTDDPVGRLLDPNRIKEIREAGGTDEEWTVINLPALAHQGDPMGRPVGAPLFPEKFSEQRLRSIKAVIGSYMWSALYDGSPVVKGGNYIRVDKFVIKSPNEVPLGLRWVRFWDLATSENETADFTAGCKIAIDQDGNLWIADIERGQWEWPRARGRIKVIAEAEKILVGVEAVGGFKTSFANLREVVSPEVVIHECGVDADKLTRALPWIGLAEAGKVFLVRGDWNIPFIKEASEFPSGSHDDQVDGISGGYALLKGAKRVWIA